MQGQVKFKEDRPFAKPEGAAQELMRIFRAFIAAKNDPTIKHTYAGVTNRAFVSESGASIDEWSLGIAYCKAQGWITMDGGGRIFPTDTAPTA
jgi:hypothetical protein